MFAFSDSINQMLSRMGSEIKLVLVFGCLLFFGLQCVLLARIILRRQRELKSLQTGRAYNRKFYWMLWVQEFFPEDDQTWNHNRNDAGSGLDSYLEDDGDLQLLSRLTIVAPLMGLLITFVGFLFFSPVSAGGKDLDLGEVFAHATPLLIGVAAGAALATLNHFFVHVAGRYCDAVRRDAARWFDTNVWRRPVPIRQSAAEIEVSLGRLNQAYHHHIGEQQKTLKTLKHFGTTFSGLQHELAELPKLFVDVMKVIPPQMEKLVEFVERLQAALETCEESVERAAAGSQQFQEAVEQQLVPAANVHHKASQHIYKSAAMFAELCNQLQNHMNSFGGAAQGLVDQMQHDTQAMAEAVAEHIAASKEAGPALASVGEAARRIEQIVGDLHLTVEQNLLPANETLLKTAKQSKDNGEKVAHFIQQGLEPAISQLTDFAKVIQQIRVSIDTLKQQTPDADELKSMEMVFGNVIQVAHRAVVAINELAEAANTINIVARGGSPPDNGNGRRGGIFGNWSK